VSTQSKDAHPVVLLVDDNAINLNLLVMFMKKCGYPYASAANGLEALQQYQAASPANPLSSAKEEVIDESTPTSTVNRAITHILMDISMPVMDGFEATRQIRKFEKVHTLTPAKVIALTGLASQQAQEEASASGVDAYLAKPVKFRELKKVLDEAK
jgi:CheY-like chemotaxis protein